MQDNRLAENRVNKFVTSMRDRQVREAAAAQAAAPVVLTPIDGAAIPARGGAAARAAVFDPQMLAKLGHLELIAATVVDGFLSGKHRSTHKGGCTDFAEFRPYAKGDDIRLLDWRAPTLFDRPASARCVCRRPDSAGIEAAHYR